MDARLNMDLACYTVPATGRTTGALIHSHMKLVRKIAWHVHSRLSSSIEIDDLIQIGTVALIEAADAFEDRGQAAFSTYATVRVRGAMIDALRKSSTMVRSAMRRRREIGTARSSLEGLLGRPATDAEMAERLDTTVDAYRAATIATQAIRHESMDDAYSDHKTAFADDAPDAFEDLSRDRLQRAIAASIRALPSREAMVLQLYFVEEMNLEEIGQTLRVGAARVCQIKKTALDKVRASLAGWHD